jgi:GTPase SAR1 family protein
MNEIQQHLVETLQDIARRLRKVGLPAEHVVRMEQLAAHVDHHCVVAVVGRVKAGKSSFINALLGSDLAMVGSVETTATINHFCFGTPPADKPVCCHWRSGAVTDESSQFLDELQGNDLETLKKADAISYLEYRLRNPHLEEITLVDTPGTEAVVDSHQQRLAEFLKMDKVAEQLRTQLRARHHEETLRIGGEADAIIYLIGETTRITDQAFLDEFTTVTQQGQARALNAIGVMAKIDLNDDVVERRKSLAQKIATQLHNNLNTVIPVSSSIQRGLEEICSQNHVGLKYMIAALSSIPAQALDEMLSDSSLYHDPDMEYLLSLAEREKIRGKMQWRAFVTIARIAVDSALDEAAKLQKIRDIAGFDQLRRVLDEHFVKRGHLLRAYRIVHDAMEIIRSIRFTYLPQVDKREAEDNEKKQRFLSFINNAGGNSPVAHELKLFLEGCFLSSTGVRMVVEEVERSLGRIKYELEDYNADFEALQKLAAPENASIFTPQERNELQTLFGLYGLETARRLSPEYATLVAIGERQGCWEEKSQWGKYPVLRSVARQAVRRYGLLAEALLSK